MASVFADVGGAQVAPTQTTNVGDADAPLAGWHGRLEWSFHGKEDLSRRPNENRSETKFDGQAELKVHQIGGQRLIGILDGTQKVDTLWWGFPHGDGQVCRGSAPPTRVWARVEGSMPAGATPLSLNLTDVHAQIDVPWSGGGSHLRCDQPLPIDNAATLVGLVRALQPVGDGSYKAEFHTSQPLMEAHWSVVVRPGYCGFGMDRGGVFASSATRPSAIIHASPSATSPSVYASPNGTRLAYNLVMQVDGQTWFHILPLGSRPAGWISSNDLACVRPYEPAPMRPVFPGYLLETPRSIASQGGARG